MALLDLLTPVVDNFVANPGQIGVGIALIGLVLYWRKATSAAGIMSSVMGKIVVSAAIIGILLLAGVIPRINVDMAIGYAETAWNVANRLVTQVAPRLS